MKRRHVRKFILFVLAITFFRTSVALTDDKIVSSTATQTRILRNVDLGRTKSFYLVVWGSNISSVDVQAVRSVKPMRVDFRLTRYADWVPDKYEQTEVHVFWTMTPKELLGDDHDPVDVAVTPRRKDGTPVDAMQVATAFDEKTFLGRLQRRTVGRDMLAVIPMRFYPQRAERALINFYSEDVVCGQLEVWRDDGSRVQEVPHEWVHYTKLPSVIPWLHQEGRNPPGRYQAQMRIVTDSACEKLKENEDSSYVVYSFFDVLR